MFLLAVCKNQWIKETECPSLSLNFYHVKHESELENYYTVYNFLLVGMLASGEMNLCTILLANKNIQEKVLSWGFIYESTLNKHVS